MASRSYDDEAVQIAKCIDQNGRPVLQVDFTSFHRVIGKAPDKLISIVCISGPYRKGKSFLLNIFLQYLENGDEDSDKWIETTLDKQFKYNNSSKGVTAGIWIWSEPFVIKNNEGRDVAVYLMDSQGWHDCDTPLAHNALLFGMSTLLSSVMIYNLDKVINESDLQFLQNFAFNAKWVDSETMDDPFQKLLIVVRDWNSDDYPLGFYDGCGVNGKDFLSDNLKPNSAKTADGKQMRKLIQSGYEQVSACLLPYPGDIIRSNKFNAELMAPDFRYTVVEFIKRLFHADSIVTKKLGDRQLTGAELFTQARKWHDSFNRSDSFVGMSYMSANEAEFNMAFSSALDLYETRAMSGMKIANDKDKIKLLLAELRQLKEECLAGFDSNHKLEKLDRKSKRKTREKLMIDLDKRHLMYTSILESNLERFNKQGEIEKYRRMVDEMKQKADSNEDLKELFLSQARMYEKMAEDNRKQIEVMQKNHQQEMAALRSSIPSRRGRCNIL